MSAPGTDEHMVELLAAGGLTMLMMMSNKVFDVVCVGYPDPGATNEIRFSLTHMPERRFSIKVEAVDDERTDGAPDGGAAIDEDASGEPHRERRDAQVG